jgi:hypothetical protein
LPVFAKAAFRHALSKTCAAHAALGPASLVLYDVSTLHSAMVPAFPPKAFDAADPLACSYPQGSA